MANAKADDAATLGAGGCPYRTNGVTCERTASRDCSKCGWNPDNGVGERRVAAAMREYRRRREAGEIAPATW